MSEHNQTKDVLDRICIAMPCSVDWNDMQGDDKIRLCGGCNKNVYNISAMSKSEAEELLSAPVLPCIQISRSDDGTIITEKKSNVVQGFWSYGKTAVSAVLSLFATFAPQWAAAADEKTRSLYLRGKPAVVTPRDDAKNQVKHQTPPALPGVPIYVPRNQNAASFWPSTVSGLGFASEDLPLAILEKFTAEQFKAIENKTFPLKNVPPQLDQKAWELFFKARKHHLTAAMHLVNKELEVATKDCQESQKLYQLALEQIARGRHDEAFAALVYQEQNKTTQMEQQCRQCLNLGPQAK